MKRAVSSVLAAALFAGAVDAHAATKGRRLAHRRAAASKPVAIPETGVLSLKDLIGLAAIGLEPREQDPFTENPMRKYVGRQFRTSQGFGSPGDASTAGRWSYDTDQKSLTLEASHWDGFPITSSSSPAGSYTGQNAFGVKVLVTKYFDMVVQLEDSSVNPWTPYVAKLPMVPDDARATSVLAQLVLEGELADTSLHSPVECHRRIAEATIDDPIEVTRMVCTIAVHFKRIAFMENAIDDKVLKEWSPPN